MVELLSEEGTKIVHVGHSLGVGRNIKELRKNIKRFYPVSKINFTLIIYT